MNRYELESHLIKFAVLIIKIVEIMPSSKAGNHLGGQLVRSGTSCPLNYGEAQSAESPRDFVHKMSIVLKELRESFVCLQIIDQANLFDDKRMLESTLKENNELISIFVKSISTSKKNRNS